MIVCVISGVGEGVGVRGGCVDRGVGMPGVRRNFCKRGAVKQAEKRPDKEKTNSHIEKMPIIRKKRAPHIEKHFWGFSGEGS